jgi:pimeloyl-ACP methyl ester carboxylesterase
MVTARRADPAGSPHAASQPAREQSRARYPDRTGYVERGGVRSFFEVYGDGVPALLFAPTWSIVHSRIWKAQIHYFARRHRVITVDTRGNGRSDRPIHAGGYSEEEFAGALFAVLEATDTDRAVIVSLSLGAQRALIAATTEPERVAGLVFLSPAVPIGDPVAGRDVSFDEPLESDHGWAKYNRHFWRREYGAFLDFFFAQCFTELHSTKQVEDAVGWGFDTDAETLIATNEGPSPGADAVRARCAAVSCPTLVVQGDADAVTGPGRGFALARAIPNARLATIAGGGHIPNARDPVRVNLLIRDFVAGLGVGT